MKRTEILCVECFKKKLLTEDEVHAYCDECGTEFIITDIKKNEFRYKRHDDK